LRREGKELIGKGEVGGGGSLELDEWRRGCWERDENDGGWGEEEEVTGGTIISV
jgi:hypothetical protein